MSSKPPPPPHAAFLAAPAIRDAIQAMLHRRGVRPADVEDVTQDVIERALRTSHPPPSQDECLRLVRKIAKDLAIDTFRLQRGRAKYNAGPYENPDDVAAAVANPGEERHPIDAARQLELLNREIEKGTITARQASILASNALDTPHAEIAAQLKLAPQTIRNELGAARRTVRASWAAYVATAVFGTLALVVWLNSRPENVAHAPPAPRPPATTPPADLVRDQRLQALRACHEQRWQSCLEGLDHAARLDPTGDAAAEVQQARTEAREHLAQPQNRAP